MKRILVAEDDDATRHAVGRLLAKAGYEVVSVPDGQDALERMQESAFDLVLTDIWMPRLNGLELMARLKETASPPKVVVMTIDSAPGTLLQAVREHAYSYLTKPIEPDGLLHLVADALSDTSESTPIDVISAKPDWVELGVPCTQPAAERVQSFMLTLEADLDEATRTQVASAFYELLSNAVEWGGKLDPNAKVRIAYLRFEHMLLYRIRDPGPGFRLEDLAHASVTHPNEPLAHVQVREDKGLRPGGFGIAMARAMVDELLYNETQNEVVFVKYLDTESEDSAT